MEVWLSVAVANVVQRPRRWKLGCKKAARGADSTVRPVAGHDPSRGGGGDWLWRWEREGGGAEGRNEGLDDTAAASAASVHAGRSKNRCGGIMWHRALPRRQPNQTKPASIKAPKASGPELLPLDTSIRHQPPSDQKNDRHLHPFRHQPESSLGGVPWRTPR